MNKYHNFITSALFVLIVTATLCRGDTYYTWPGIEVDKCASYWLIKNFVDTEAVIKIIAKNDSFKKAIPFDIPHAEFSRKHGKTCFDTILEKYSLDDPAILRIASIVRDVEINVWAKKKMEETVGIQKIIFGMDELFEDDLECLEASEIIFQALYEIYSKEMK
jgi:hypothetical protein